MEDLKSVLESFTKINGVTYVIMSNSQGETLESIGEVNRDFEMPALMAIDISELCSDFSSPYSSSELSQSFIEFKNMIVISIPIKSEYYLSIISSSEVNLGRIRLEIKKCKKNIETLLPGF